MLYIFFKLLYSIRVLRERNTKSLPSGTENSSSFSPLSYIIQKAIYLVSCFLNFKRRFALLRQRTCKFRGGVGKKRENGPPRFERGGFLSDRGASCAIFCASKNFILITLCRGRAAFSFVGGANQMCWERGQKNRVRKGAEQGNADVQRFSLYSDKQSLCIYARKDLTNAAKMV